MNETTLFVGPKGGCYVRENGEKKYVSQLSPKRKNEILSKLPSLKEIKFRVRDDLVFGPVSHTDVSIFFRQFPSDPLAKSFEERRGFPERELSRYLDKDQTKAAKAKCPLDVLVEKVKIHDVNFITQQTTETEKLGGKKRTTRSRKSNWQSGAKTLMKTGLQGAGEAIVEDALEFLLSRDMKWTQIKDDVIDKFCNKKYASKVLKELGKAVMSKSFQFGAADAAFDAWDGNGLKVADDILSGVGSAMMVNVGLFVESSVFNGMKSYGKEWERHNRGVNVKAALDWIPSPGCGVSYEDLRRTLPTDGTESIRSVNASLVFGSVADAGVGLGVCTRATNISEIVKPEPSCTVKTEVVSGTDWKWESRQTVETLGSEVTMESSNVTVENVLKSHVRVSDRLSCAVVAIPFGLLKSDVRQSWEGNNGAAMTTVTTETCFSDANTTGNMALVDRSRTVFAEKSRSIDTMYTRKFEKSRSIDTMHTSEESSNGVYAHDSHIHGQSAGDNVFALHQIQAGEYSNAIIKRDGDVAAENHMVGVSEVTCQSESSHHSGKSSFKASERAATADSNGVRTLSVTSRTARLSHFPVENQATEVPNESTVINGNNRCNRSHSRDIKHQLVNHTEHRNGMASITVETNGGFNWSESNHFENSAGDTTDFQRNEHGSYQHLAAETSISGNPLEPLFQHRNVALPSSMPSEIRQEAALNVTAANRWKQQLESRLDCVDLAEGLLVEQGCFDTNIRRQWRENDVENIYDENGAGQVQRQIEDGHLTSVHETSGYRFHLCSVSDTKVSKIDGGQDSTISMEQTVGEGHREISVHPGSFALAEHETALRTSTVTNNIHRRFGLGLFNSTTNTVALTNSSVQSVRNISSSADDSVSNERFLSRTVTSHEKHSNPFFSKTNVSVETQDEWGLQTSKTTKLLNLQPSTHVVAALDVGGNDILWNLCATKGGQISCKVIGRSMGFAFANSLCQEQIQNNLLRDCTDSPAVRQINGAFCTVYQLLHGKSEAAARASVASLASLALQYGTGLPLTYHTTSNEVRHSLFGRSLQSIETGHRLGMSLGFPGLPAVAHLNPSAGIMFNKTVDLFSLSNGQLVQREAGGVAAYGKIGPLQLSAGWYNGVEHYQPHSRHYKENNVDMVAISSGVKSFNGLWTFRFNAADRGLLLCPLPAFRSTECLSVLNYRNDGLPLSTQMDLPVQRLSANTFSDVHLKPSDSRLDPAEVLGRCPFREDHERLMQNIGRVENVQGDLHKIKTKRNLFGAMKKSVDREYCLVAADEANALQTAVLGGDEDTVTLCTVRKELSEQFYDLQKVTRQKSTFGCKSKHVNQVTSGSSIQSAAFPVFSESQVHSTFKLSGRPLSCAHSMGSKSMNGFSGSTTMDIYSHEQRTYEHTGAQQSKGEYKTVITEAEGVFHCYGDLLHSDAVSTDILGGQNAQVVSSEQDSIHGRARTSVNHTDSTAGGASMEVDQAEFSVRSATLARTITNTFTSNEPSSPLCVDALETKRVTKLNDGTIQTTQKVCVTTRIQDVATQHVELKQNQDVGTVNFQQLLPEEGGALIPVARNDSASGGEIKGDVERTRYSQGYVNDQSVHSKSHVRGWAKQTETVDITLTTPYKSVASIRSGFGANAEVGEAAKEFAPTIKTEVKAVKTAHLFGFVDTTSSTRVVTDAGGTVLDEVPETVTLSPSLGTSAAVGALVGSLTSIGCAAVFEGKVDKLSDKLCEAAISTGESYLTAQIVGVLFEDNFYGAVGALGGVAVTAASLRCLCNTDTNRTKADFAVDAAASLLTTTLKASVTDTLNSQLGGAVTVAIPIVVDAAKSGVLLVMGKTTAGKAAEKAVTSTVSIAAGTVASTVGTTLALAVVGSSPGVLGAMAVTAAGAAAFSSTSYAVECVSNKIKNHVGYICSDGKNQLSLLVSLDDVNAALDKIHGASKVDVKWDNSKWLGSNNSVTAFERVDGSVVNTEEDCLAFEFGPRNCGVSAQYIHRRDTTTNMHGDQTLNGAERGYGMKCALPGVSFSVELLSRVESSSVSACLEENGMKMIRETDSFMSSSGCLAATVEVAGYSHTLKGPAKTSNKRIITKDRNADGTALRTFTEPNRHLETPQLDDSALLPSLDQHMASNDGKSNKPIAIEPSTAQEHSMFKEFHNANISGTGRNVTVTHKSTTADSHSVYGGLYTQESETTCDHFVAVEAAAKDSATVTGNKVVRHSHRQEMYLEGSDIRRARTNDYVAVLNYSATDKEYKEGEVRNEKIVGEKKTQVVTLSHADKSPIEAPTVKPKEENQFQERRVNERMQRIVDTTGKAVSIEEMQAGIITDTKTAKTTPDPQGNIRITTTSTDSHLTAFVDIVQVTADNSTHLYGPGENRLITTEIGQDHTDVVVTDTVNGSELSSTDTPVDNGGRVHRLVYQATTSNLVSTYRENVTRKFEAGVRTETSAPVFHEPKNKGEMVINSTSTKSTTHEFVDQVGSTVTTKPKENVPSTTSISDKIICIASALLQTEHMRTDEETRIDKANITENFKLKGERCVNGVAGQTTVDITSHLTVKRDIECFKKTFEGEPVPDPNRSFTTSTTFALGTFVTHSEGVASPAVSMEFRQCNAQVTSKIDHYAHGTVQSTLASTHTGTGENAQFEIGDKDCIQKATLLRKETTNTWSNSSGKLYSVSVPVEEKTSDGRKDSSDGCKDSPDGGDETSKTCKFIDIHRIDHVLTQSVPVADKANPGGFFSVHQFAELPAEQGGAVVARTLPASQNTVTQHSASAVAEPQDLASQDLTAETRQRDCYETGYQVVRVTKNKAELKSGRFERTMRTEDTAAKIQINSKIISGHGSSALTTETSRQVDKPSIQTTHTLTERKPIMALWNETEEKVIQTDLVAHQETTIRKHTDIVPSAGQLRICGSLAGTATTALCELLFGSLRKNDNSRVSLAEHIRNEFGNRVQGGISFADSFLSAQFDDVMIQTGVDFSHGVMAVAGTAIVCDTAKNYFGWKLHRSFDARFLDPYVLIRRIYLALQDRMELATRDLRGKNSKDCADALQVCSSCVELIFSVETNELLPMFTALEVDFDSTIHKDRIVHIQSEVSNLQHLTQTEFERNPVAFLARVEAWKLACSDHLDVMEKVLDQCQKRSNRAETLNELFITPLVLRSPSEAQKIFMICIQQLSSMEPYLMITFCLALKECCSPSQWIPFLALLPKLLERKIFETLCKECDLTSPGKQMERAFPKQVFNASLLCAPYVIRNQVGDQVVKALGRNVGGILMNNVGCALRIGNVALSVAQGVTSKSQGAKEVTKHLVDTCCASLFSGFASKLATSALGKEIGSNKGRFILVIAATCGAAVGGYLAGTFHQFQEERDQREKREMEEKERLKKIAEKRARLRALLAKYNLDPNLRLDSAEVNKQWRKLSLVCHPDTKHGSTQKQLELTADMDELKQLALTPEVQELIHLAEKLGIDDTEILSTNESLKKFVALVEGQARHAGADMKAFLEDIVSYVNNCWM